MVSVRMTVEVLNFGCRLNMAEGETLARDLASEDDLIVINSCAVTAEAERQARQAIRRAKRLRPEARIALTGCARTSPSLVAMPEISEIWDKPVRPTPSVSGANHARAFIEVQNGCDHGCTFCITTIARGASRSIGKDAVIDAVKAAVDRGQHEVVLTGIDLSSYGQDFSRRSSLGQLVETILRNVPALPRLRLSSLDCAEIDPLLEELITSEPRIMPHLHLSLQHGADLILKRMKRRHSAAQAIALVERVKAKRPEIAIGADLIAGFPTEDVAMHEASRALIDDCDIVFGHIFPYSPRPGTAAARMPQAGREVAKARAAELRTHAATRKAKWLASLVGTRQRGLIELDNQTGHLDTFANVRLEAPLPSGNMRGTMTDLIITASDGDTLTARQL
jgi:threonylcarbamoyladenosine tRNA methylthiotransferase MtaB